MKNGDDYDDYDDYTYHNGNENLWDQICQIENAEILPVVPDLRQDLCLERQVTRGKDAKTQPKDGGSSQHQRPHGEKGKHDQGKSHNA